MRKNLKTVIGLMFLLALGICIALATLYTIYAEEQLNERNRARQLDHIGSVQERSQRVANMIAGDR